jgi:hypothetical protein
MFRERDSITPFIWKRRQPEMRRWWGYRGLRSGDRLRRASKGGNSVDLRFRSPRKVPFVEISSLRDNGTLSDWVIELPAPSLLDFLPLPSSFGSLSGLAVQ